MTYKTFEDWYDCKPLPRILDIRPELKEPMRKANLDLWNEARKYPEEKIQKALNYLKAQKKVIDACETKTDRLILDLVVMVDSLIEILEDK